MKLLFVCTGNTCRSPLAESLASRTAVARDVLEIISSSAGTSAWEGAPASDGAMLIGMENGLDLGRHRARQLSAEIVMASDLILVMGQHHLDRVEALGGAGKSFLLSDFASHGHSQAAVADPFGGDLDAYRATFVELDEEIGRVFDRLTVERGG